VSQPVREPEPEPEPEGASGPRPVAEYNQVAARDLSRIAALSDGVFAIAMTLIVFEIRLPDPGGIHTDADLWNALVLLGPRLVTYLLSFLTLGIFWSGQQTQLNQFERADRHLSWIYIGFLAAVALMPFSTSLLAEFITFRLALIGYWANIAVIGLILFGALEYSVRHDFLRRDLPPGLVHVLRRRILVAQTLYAIGALLAVFGTTWSILFIVIVQLNFAIAPRIPWLSRI
jgi:uncharacterized membrane protein